MAIETKKKGVLPENQPFTGTCRKCGCVVECLRKDAEEFSESTGTGRNKQTVSGYRVPCPTAGCGEQIVVVRGSAPEPPRDPRDTLPAAPWRPGTPRPPRWPRPDDFDGPFWFAERPAVLDRGPNAPYRGPGPATLHSTDVPAPE